MFANSLGFFKCFFSYELGFSLIKRLPIKLAKIAPNKPPNN